MYCMYLCMYLFSYLSVCLYLFYVLILLSMYVLTFLCIKKVKCIVFANIFLEITGLYGTIQIIIYFYLVNY